jgi:micrococcal nuclease
MKLVARFLLLFFSTFSYAQTVPPDSAKYHEGSLTIVCGKVMGTFKSKSGTTFINFGAAFPNQTFSAVIMESSLEKFSYQPVDYLKNKDVCVTGMVKMYKEKPEILIKGPNQIREQ